MLNGVANDSEWIISSLVGITLKLLVQILMLHTAHKFLFWFIGLCNFVILYHEIAVGEILQLLH